MEYAQTNYRSTISADAYTLTEIINYNKLSEIEAAMDSGEEWELKHWSAAIYKKRIPIIRYALNNYLALDDQRNQRIVLCSMINTGLFDIARECVEKYGFELGYWFGHRAVKAKLWHHVDWAVRNGCHITDSMLIRTACAGELPTIKLMHATGQASPATSAAAATCAMFCGHLNVVVFYQDLGIHVAPHAIKSVMQHDKLASVKVLYDAGIICPSRSKSEIIHWVDFASIYDANTVAGWLLGQITGSDGDYDDGDECELGVYEDEGDLGVYGMDEEFGGDEDCDFGGDDDFDGNYIDYN